MMDDVWLNGRMVAMIASGSVYSVHSDQTGRALAVTDANSNIVWEAQGLPFDRNTITGNWPFFTLGFPGQSWDNDSGLWYNGYRDYDPYLGRYIQSDPIGLGGGVNTYAYVDNNPVSLVDPLGLRPLTACEKSTLKPYITQQDLDNADLHDGEVPRYLQKGYDGITRGNDIYFRPGVYNPSTPAGIALLGHELMHVGQYRQGMTWVSYVWSTRRGYANSKYEKPAYAMQSRIQNNLNNDGFSDCRCQR